VVKRKGLVVAINKYGTRGDLTSCIRDAEAVRGMLRSRFDFTDVHGCTHYRLGRSLDKISAST
jgi:hypothetical protein